MYILKVSPGSRKGEGVTDPQLSFENITPYCEKEYIEKNVLSFYH